MCLRAFRRTATPGVRFVYNTKLTDREVQVKAWADAFRTRLSSVIHALTRSPASGVKPVARIATLDANRGRRVESVEAVHSYPEAHVEGLYGCPLHLGITLATCGRSGKLQPLT